MKRVKCYRHLCAIVDAVKRGTLSSEAAEGRVAFFITVPKDNTVLSAQLTEQLEKWVREKLCATFLNINRLS